MNRQQNRFESVARPDDEDEDDWLDTPDEEEPVELLFKESLFPPTCVVCPRQMDMVVVVVV